MTPVTRVALALGSGIAATLLLIWLADVKGAWRLLAACFIAYCGLLFLVTEDEPEEPCERHEAFDCWICDGVINDG